MRFNFKFILPCRRAFVKMRGDISHSAVAPDPGGCYNIDMKCLRFFDYYTLPPEGTGFVLFGALHLSWLCAIALLIFVCARFYRGRAALGQRRTELALAWTAVGLQWLRDLLLLAGGHFEVGFLPLHLCGLSVYLILWNAYRSTPLKQELLYCLTLPGAVFALLFPNWNVYPFFNFMHLSSFLIHALLVAYPIVLLVGGKLHPDARRLPRCLLCFLALCVPVAAFNHAFGTNFMFLSQPSPGSPLAFFARYLGDPGYLLGGLLILLAVWALLYGLPFLFRQLK